MAKPTHPLKGESYRLTLDFGARYPWSWLNISSLRRLAGRIHQGIDWAFRKGTEVRGPLPMKITFAGWGGSYGNLLKALTPDGRYELYFAHLHRIGIKTIGKIIEKGQVFAWGGSTGKSSGDHLHFGVYDRLLGRFISPDEWLATYRYIDKQEITDEQVKKSFLKVWKRKPALGDWRVFAERLDRKEIAGIADLENKMLYWAHQVWGKDLKTIQKKGDAKWQRMKEKYLL